MASVNDYLKKLLYQYDCVVVPELGAFLTHYQPATFTESEGLYLPPRKRVAFNEALRLDDGILANYIMLHEPFTREGAQRHISMFVSKLRQQVLETSRFEIDGIGTFTQNTEGRLQFDPSLRHNFFGEAYGLSAIPAQRLVADPIQAVVVSAPAQTGLGPVLVEEETTFLQPVRRSQPYWRVAAAALLVGSIGLVSYFSVIKPGQPLQSSLDPSNLFRIPSVAIEQSTEKKITPAKPATPVATPAPAVKPVPVVVTAPTPVVKEQPVVVPVTKPTPTSVEVAKPVRTEPYFTVIAGSFSSKRNALRLKRQLRKAGYADAFVITPSQKGQLYKVAAAGSADRIEAIANVASISKLAGTTAWIYKN